MLSENSFQTVSILSEKKVEENFQMIANDNNNLNENKNWYNYLLFIILLRLVLIIALSVFLSWRGKIIFYWESLGFPESIWTKFCQEFRIQKQFQNQSEKVAFFKYISSSKKIPE